MNPNPLARLKAMIHYIIEASPPRALGKVKLNKILWFADRDQYLRTGKTISGDAYLRYPQGPVSKHLLEALRELAAEKKIHIRQEKVISYDQYCYISLEEPDVAMFTAEDLAAITRSISFITPLTAQQASNLSHDRTWEIFEDKEEIPMFAVLASQTRDLQDDDLKWAMEE